MNRLYFGDNVGWLPKIEAESVDLIYLDPPFNSKADYNVLHKGADGRVADAQLRAFKDTWKWHEDAAADALDEIAEIDQDVFRLLAALRVSLGESDMMTYLVMMARRLVELRRVLKPEGSIYLHCDPTASRYLGVILDAILGPSAFRNEIVWKRTSAHSAARKWGPVHDTILFYSRSKRHVWNKAFQPYDQTYIDEFYTHVDRDGRRWRRSDLTGAGIRRGATGRAWRGTDVTAKGRHWFVPPEELDQLDAEGKIHWPAKQGGVPQLKRYLDEQPGVPLQDVIVDIPPLHNLAQERLGYQTQKPVALLERILAASTNPGDLVLDPFCGCGTTVHAAERMGRQWIGIDVSYAAILVIQDRMRRWLPNASYKVEGIPASPQDARELARLDKHLFEQWAVGRLGGQPKGRGGDSGIDGRILFKTGARERGEAIVSVKGGEHLNPGMLRDLGHVVERERATFGVLVCAGEPTSGMRREASSSPYIELLGEKRRKLQILTVENLFERNPLGIVTGLNRLQEEAEIRAERRRRDKPREAKELRKQPELPPMPIKGGKATQKTLDFEEPLLAPPQPRRRRG